MTPVISVVIPTHNPREDYLARVIEALRQQTLPRERWELVVVDNGSRAPLRAGVGLQDDGTTGPQDGGTSLPSHVPTFPPFTEIDLSWHPNARIVQEEKLGLTFARLRGFAEAKGELIVMVDDDNVLAPDYLETAVRIARDHPMLGAFGGKCLPEFETKPDSWLEARGKGLGLRDRGEVPQLFPEETGGGPRDDRTTGQWGEEASVSVNQCFGGTVGKPELVKNRAESARQREAQPRATTANRQRRAVREFPACAPIGAGMVLRRDAAATYAERIKQRTTGRRGNGTITDRRGDSLASGGDNDICLTVVEEGWRVGYLPQLKLTHLIPRRRMTLDYHKRMARDSMKSFILMLDQHGIRPWPAMAKWTLHLRVTKDFLRVKPWQGPEQSLRFWGHVGMYEGRAALAALPTAAAVDSGQ